MKKILVVASLDDPGGASSVGAWMLVALKDAGHSVSVLTWSPPDLGRLNSMYGTALEPSDFLWYSMPLNLVRVMRASPFRLSLLAMHLLFREAQRLSTQEQYDVVISTMNEIEVGARAVQYIHYPSAYYPRPNCHGRWYHLEPLVLSYRAMATRISGYSRERVARNVTLVNSDWTGQRYQEWYGTAARTLYPPVPGGFPDVPFDQRDRAFACVGRIAPGKELEKVIEILAQVRRIGHDVTLRVIGQTDHRAYLGSLTADAHSRWPWVSFHLDLPREEMVRLIARSRFGIHGMVGEHFGIAPAELQRAGCITFVPHEGGPVEIVSNDARVIYRSIEDAVEKIHRLLSDPELERAVQADVAARAERFSEQRFMSEIRAVIDSFEP